MTSVGKIVGIWKPSFIDGGRVDGGSHSGIIWQYLVIWGIHASPLPQLRDANGKPRKAAWPEIQHPRKRETWARAVPMICNSAPPKCILFQKVLFLPRAPLPPTWTTPPCDLIQVLEGNLEALKCPGRHEWISVMGKLRDRWENLWFVDQQTYVCYQPLGLGQI